MPNRFASLNAAVRGPDPGSGSVAVDALLSDTVNLTITIRSLYCTVAGTVKFTSQSGLVDTWTVPANFIIPVQMKRVWSTGTTATGLKGIY
jgi:hypothetical protein